MRARPLLAAIAVVLPAHAVLLVALAGHGSHASAGANVRGVRRLVLVDPRPAQGSSTNASATGSPQPASARRHDPPSPAASDMGDERPRLPSADVAPPPADRTASIGIYRAAAVLDVQARARSAPDIAFLAGLPWSGMPLRLRLFIDAQGEVVDTQVLQSAEADDVVDRVRRMFLATGFTAGVQDGHIVPSYKDVEVTAGAPL
jgi:hypothetical protein